MQIITGAEAFSSPGSGTTADVAVLCLHGLTSSPQSMLPVADALAARGYRVSAPRLPGHGTRWQAMALTRYQDWLTAVEAEAVRLRREAKVLVCVGLSLGGALVTDLAARRPDLVDGLVLINPAFTASDRRLRFLPVLKHVIATVPGLGDDIRRPGPPRELAYDQVPVKAFASFAAQWPALAAALPSVRVPVLLFRSAHDAVVPPSSAELVLSRIGSDDLTCEVLHDSAHVATLDQEVDRIISQTADFVARVGP